MNGGRVLLGVGLVMFGALGAGCSAKRTSAAMPPAAAPSATVPPPATGASTVTTPPPKPPPRTVKEAPPRSSPPPSAPGSAPTAVLSPQMAPSEETRLRQLATDRIEDTERIVRRIDQRKLDTDQRQTFSTVQTFLVKARDALGANDVQGAYNLADKARALASDLAKR